MLRRYKWHIGNWIRLTILTCLSFRLFLLKGHLDILCQSFILLWVTWCFVNIFLRWAENNKVAASVIHVWKFIEKLLNSWKKLTKFKRSKRKILADAYDDYLMLPKLHSLAYVTNLFERFLKKYKTDKPMILFLFFNLKKIFTRLLGIIIKPCWICCNWRI